MRPSTSFWQLSVTKPWANARRRSWNQIITNFVVLCGIYFPVAAVLHLSSVVWSSVVFAILCALVSAHFKAIPLAVMPLLLIPSHLFTSGTAIAATAVLSVGAVAVPVLLALAEFTIMSWRKDIPLARAAVVNVAGRPAKGVILACIVIGYFIHAGTFGALILCVPAFFYWKGHYTASGITAVVASAFGGWAIIPLVLAVLAFVLDLVRLTARPPRHQLRFPRPSPLRAPWSWLRAALCDMRLRRGDLIAARHVLRPGQCDSYFCRLRAVYLDLEEGYYQSGLDCDRLPETAPAALRPYWMMCYGRALSGIAQFVRARAVYAETLSSKGCPPGLVPTLSLLAAENELAAGELDAAQARTESLLPSLAGRKNYLARLRLYRILAEVALAVDDKPGAKHWLDRTNDELVSHRWTRRIIMSPRQDRTVRLMFGPKGSTYLQLARFDILGYRAAQADASNADADFDLEAYVLAMSLARCWDDLIDLLVSWAETAAENGNYVEAAGLGARALMELDRTRYSLAAQTARTSWSKRFHRGLAVTLEAAYHLKDHRFQAELIEFSRVQTLPAANGEAIGGLALVTPPVVRVRGHARVAHPGLPGRPAPVAIEEAAVRAAGLAAWWLSYWESGTWLYWSLIPPAGESIQGGRESIVPGSALSKELAELRHSLPALLPGEDAAAADFRLANSPLLANPAAEEQLSRGLGRLLLPERLITAARHRRAAGSRLPLAIAPSASLGYVPWSLLVAGDQPYDRLDPERLVDVCDWVLAPSSALLTRAKPAAPGRAPLTLAIVDTCATAELGELTGARRQAQSLPAEVTVLGGRHWTAAAATITEIEQQFRHQSTEFTAAFMCHAVRGTPDEPSTGGLVMAGHGAASAPSAPSSDLAVLRPSTIFGMVRRRVSMPAQVLLEACDTSALSDTGSGEWLTIAPAFVAGGSREVIATLYPVPDDSNTNYPLMQAAIAGTSLCAALRDQQRQALVRWTSGQAWQVTDTPLAWAAYAPICVQETSFDQRPVQGSSEEVASARCLYILADALKICEEGRPKRLDSGYLLASYLEDSGLADDFDGGNNSLQPWALLWTLGPYTMSRFLWFHDKAARSIPLTSEKKALVPLVVLKAIRQARETARLDGTLIEPEHIILHLLKTRSAAHRILTFISRITRRHEELTIRAIGHTLANKIAEPAIRRDSQKTAEIKKFAETIIKAALSDSRATTHEHRREDLMV
jgi:hypothetical protein